MSHGTHGHRLGMWVLAVWLAGCGGSTLPPDAGADVPDAFDDGDGGGADPGADPGPGDDGGFDGGDIGPGDDGEIDAGDPGPDGDDGDTEPDAGEDGTDGGGDEGLDAGGDGDGGDPGGDEEPFGWRSSLYPIDWTPAFTDGAGRFLHDFSYAGYHAGEVDPPDVAGPIVEAVADFGADNTGATDATAIVQATIDHAASLGGGVVHLAAGLYRLDGMLQVTASGIVLRGDGAGATRLYFTRDQDMTSRANITFQGGVQVQAEWPLVADAIAREFTVALDDVSGLQPGDEVQVGAVITEAFIADHGMTGTWVAFTGQWKPFYRRTVIAVDSGVTPQRVELDAPLRYPLRVRDGASLRRIGGALTECGVEFLGLSNAIGYDQAWTFNLAHVLTMDNVKDCWIRGVESFDSPSGEDDYHLQSGGMLISNSRRVTVADCRLERAQNRGSGGNGYLFEVMKSNEILYRDCQGIRGRHNFIQNWDFGTSGCVFLRCRSAEGRMLMGTWDPIGVLGQSEYHHSLATANLVDDSALEDGWLGFNRRDESSGAGHAAAECAFWNCHGGGTVKSLQYGWGYIIGTDDLTARTSLTDLDLIYNAAGTEPEDFVESSPDGSPLVPQSLYEDQLRRRLGR